VGVRLIQALRLCGLALVRQAALLDGLPLDVLGNRGKFRGEAVAPGMVA
jgi:hypothetical protein